jgi:hypothetical protein
MYVRMSLASSESRVGLEKSGVHLGGKQDKTGEDLPLTKLSYDHDLRLDHHHLTLRHRPCLRPKTAMGRDRDPQTQRKK